MPAELEDRELACRAYPGWWSPLGVCRLPTTSDRCRPPGAWGNVGSVVPILSDRTTRAFQFCTVHWALARAAKRQACSRNRATPYTFACCHEPQRQATWVVENLNGNIPQGLEVAITCKFARSSRGLGGPCGRARLAHGRVGRAGTSQETRTQRAQAAALVESVFHMRFLIGEKQSLGLGLFSDRVISVQS